MCAPPSRFTTTQPPFWKRKTDAPRTAKAIAAIAIEYGATIHIYVRDLARFPNLRWNNPLQP